MSGSMGSMFSFRTGDDPYAEGSMGQGAKTGMAIGAMFGPVGAVAGLFVGAGVGILFSNDDRTKARKKVTKESYDFGQEVFDYTNKSREEINKGFSSARSSTVARMAGSGMKLDSVQFQSAEGQLIRERDEALSIVDAELDDFVGGPNMEWIGKDIEYMMGTGYGEGRTGERAFSEENRALIYNFGIRQPTKGDPGNRNRYGTIPTKYRRKITPSTAAYVRGQFGGEEARAKYDADLKAQIESANVWRKRKMQFYDVNAQQRARFDNRGAN